MVRGLLATLLLWGAGAGLLRTFAVPPEICPEIGVDGARESALAAATWITRSQSADGSYVYEYDIATDRPVPGYNEVRHAGVTMSLYQLAAAGEDAFLDAADAGLARMIANLDFVEDRAAFKEPGGQPYKTGSSALMLAGLAQRRLATDDGEYDDLMRQLGRFIVSMQEPGGAMLAYWDPGTQTPVPGERSKYYTGEAFWALALLHRVLPGEGWDVPALAVADYLALRRDDAEGLDFPPWADQWAAYGLAEVAAWPGDSRLAQHHIDYARSLAGRFGLLVRVESRRTGSEFSERVRGQMARAAGMGTWGEGLGSLWALAAGDPRMADLVEPIGDRSVCVAGMLAERQHRGADETNLPALSDAEGGWFRDDLTRMDDQQHAISALILASSILSRRGTQ
ncbi:MAG: hypothetical protein AB7T37_07825 [Dehalococcoidia bacterium]